MRMKRRATSWGFSALLLFAAFAAAPQGDDVTAATGEAPGDAPRAASGYVADRTCAPCHRGLYEAYKSVGMSQSFYRPSRERTVEDFDNGHFYHPASQRHYEMIADDDGFRMRRYRLGRDGERRDVLEREIHWVLGSGSSSRTYIHQTEWGELYQLPLGWYATAADGSKAGGGRWAMSPGFDKPDHKGFNRRVQRDCMFCHNAYPDVPAGSDRFGEPQVFPVELPEGLGCQRCHGPGADHVRLAYNVDASDMLISGSIVNPGRFSPERRDEVCMQCHLQPSVTHSGVRHLARPMYSYRPEQPLDEYLVLMDIVEEGRPAGKRFEINHHPYRLRQSRCYIQSRKADSPKMLTCLTCHDPHRKVSAAEASAHYRAACLNCHALEDCDLPAMTGPRQAGSRQASREALPAVAADNCTACHMQRRRTEDVIEATMTDHLIRRRPGGPELLARFADREPRIETVEMLEPERAPRGKQAEVYRQLAMVRGGSRAALDRLRAALAAARPEETSPYLELAVGQLSAGRFKDAVRTLLPVVEGAPDNIVANLHLGVALAGLGEAMEALRYLEHAVELAPQRPEARYNLGKLLVQLGRVDAAIVHFEAALAARPSLAAGWFDLGNAYARLGRFEETLGPYRQALAVDPQLSLAQQNLVEALLRLGRNDAAVAELEAWVHFEPDNAVARRRLQEVTAGG